MSQRELERTRLRVAEAAARLMAEHGIQDYGLAKRKAVRQLGLSDGSALPSNDEVDLALVERQDLFDRDEQSQQLRALRQEALEVMDVFSRFEPMLIGAVATGAVSEHSQIELEIALENSKEFEQFLVNQAIEFKIRDRGTSQGYLIYAEPVDVVVRLSSLDTRRASASQRARLSAGQLRGVLLTPETEQGPA